MFLVLFQLFCKFVTVSSFYKILKIKYIFIYTIKERSMV